MKHFELKISQAHLRVSEGSIVGPLPALESEQLYKNIFYPDIGSLRPLGNEDMSSLLAIEDAQPDDELMLEDARPPCWEFMDASDDWFGAALLGEDGAGAPGSGAETPRVASSRSDSPEADGRGEGHEEERREGAGDDHSGSANFTWGPFVFTWKQHGAGNTKAYWQVLCKEHSDEVAPCRRTRSLLTPSNDPNSEDSRMILRRLKVWCAAACDKSFCNDPVHGEKDVDSREAHQGLPRSWGYESDWVEDELCDTFHVQES